MTTQPVAGPGQLRQLKVCRAGMLRTCRQIANLALENVTREARTNLLASAHALTTPWPGWQQPRATVSASGEHSRLMLEKRAAAEAVLNTSGSFTLRTVALQATGAGFGLSQALPFVCRLSQTLSFVSQPQLSICLSQALSQLSVRGSVGGRAGCGGIQNSRPKPAGRGKLSLCAQSGARTNEGKTREFFEASRCQGVWEDAKTPRREIARRCLGAGEPGKTRRREGSRFLRGVEASGRRGRREDAKTRDRLGGVGAGREDAKTRDCLEASRRRGVCNHMISTPTTQQVKIPPSRRI